MSRESRKLITDYKILSISKQALLTPGVSETILPTNEASIRGVRSGNCFFFLFFFYLTNAVNREVLTLKPGLRNGQKSLTKIPNQTQPFHNLGWNPNGFTAIGNNAGLAKSERIVFAARRAQNQLCRPNVKRKKNLWISNALRVSGRNNLVKR